MVAFLLFAGLGFTVVEVVYSCGVISSLEDYITARGSVGTSATAATWAGLPAILGYALGAAAPLLVLIPVGRRIRRVMPKGTP